MTFGQTHALRPWRGAAARRRDPLWLPLGTGGLAVAVGVFGAAVPNGWLLILAAAAFTVVVLLAAASWRWIAVLLIAYLPFSGVLSLALYPQTYLGDAARDVILIVPLYAAFAMRGKPSPVPSSLRVPIVLLTILVLLGLANPSLPSLSVGLIGARSWLFFVPLVFVGAEIARTQAFALRVAKIALIAGLPVLSVGLLEALALATGQGGLIYSLYGKAAATAFTTGANPVKGASVSLGGLHRVPSLFAYPVAYYSFCMAMLVPSYFLWRSTGRRRIRALGMVGFALAATCALTSGTRFAFVAVPIAVAVTLYVDGIRASARLAIGGVAAFTATGVLLHVPLLSLPRYLFELGRVETTYVVTDGVRGAMHATWLGLGPGTDTNASRAVNGSVFFQQVGGRWQESYIAKSWIELGLPGLLLVAWLCIGSVRAVAGKALGGARGRPLVAAAAGFMIATLVISIKGAVLDQAPASPYFWLLAGMGIAAAQWPREADAPESHES